MKVLQLIHNLRAEGAQRVVVNLVAVSNAVEQQVCAWKTGGPLAQQIAGPLYLGDQPPLQGQSFLGRLRFLQQLVRQQRIDLIHAHLSDAIVMAALVKCLTGVPFVITHHCPDFMPPKMRGVKAKIYALVVRWAMRQATTHIAISAAVQQALMATLNLQQANWQVIANGVPMPSTTKTLEKPSAFPAQFTDKKLLIAVGRLDAVKDIAQLITVMPAILAIFPNVRLAIIGEGPLRTPLQTQINHLQLQNQVVLVGMSTQVEAWLKCATLFVSCSEYEGVPMALLEAMSYGLPVVASDVIGNRDVVTHLRNGWLYKKPNDDQLSETLLRVLQNDQHAQQMGQAAANWVHEHYSQAAMASAYQQLYQQLQTSS